LIPSLSPAAAASTSAAFPHFLKTDPQESRPNLLLMSSSHLHIRIGICIIISPDNKQNT
jgi:hypothetical protein